MNTPAKTVKNMNKDIKKHLRKEDPGKQAKTHKHKDNIAEENEDSDVLSAHSFSQSPKSPERVKKVSSMQVDSYTGSSHKERRSILTVRPT